MGNYLSFDTREKYVLLEATPGGFFLLGTLFMAVIFIFICLCCCYKWNCETCQCKCKCKRDSTTEGCCPDCSTILKMEKLHDILRTIFANVKEFQVQKTGTIADAEADTDTVKDQATDKTSKVLVISDREVPSGWNGCMAYIYYVYMMFMSIMWFIATAIEFSIYRKTTTCNDINVDVKSFRCFDVGKKFSVINCDAPDITERKVICYLYSPSIAGFGVAFSTAKLISVVADIAYKFIFKFTNKYCCCAFILRIALIVAALGALLAYLLVIHLLNITETYFTFGRVPMRMAQLVLVCLTVGGILVIPPWCQYTDDDFKRKYYYMGYYGDVESNPNNGIYITYVQTLSQTRAL